MIKHRYIPFSLVSLHVFVLARFFSSFSTFGFFFGKKLFFFFFF